MSPSEKTSPPEGQRVYHVIISNKYQVSKYNFVLVDECLYGMAFLIGSKHTH